MKWVFLIENKPIRIIRYKLRLVTLGYMQIPIIYYKKFFLQMATATLIRIVIGLTFVFTLKIGFVR